MRRCAVPLDPGDAMIPAFREPELVRHFVSAEWIAKPRDKLSVAVAVRSEPADFGRFCRATGGPVRIHSDQCPRMSR